ncbi:MAG: rod shape-determining protein RodA [Firmicutes bacterium]|nr:rod shape-determining protein RodA [Bacillota bacterium]
MLKKIFGGLDYWLLAAVVGLSIFGIVCIGSAVHLNLGEEAVEYYSQIKWFFAGLILLFAAKAVDYQRISEYWIFLYIFNILLLVSVFFLGSEAGGATRWLRFGGVGIQPSEFSKIIMIFCLAKLIDKKREKLDNINVFLIVLLFVAIPFVLTVEQPSLSAGMVLLAIFISELFVGGLSVKMFAKIGAVVAAGLGFIIWDLQREAPLIASKILDTYQQGRILSWINPEQYSDTYYQTLKSISAIGSGQFAGKGLYNGTLNQLSYLPEPQNDFIFSVIGEEFGFMGCIFVLGLLLFIILRLIIIGMEAEDGFSRLIIAGIVGMLGFQTFINTAVATGLVPNTGMSLPFVSYGGSSMWINMLAIGLAMNIHKQKDRKFNLQNRL